MRRGAGMTIWALFRRFWYLAPIIALSIVVMLSRANTAHWRGQYQLEYAAHRLTEANERVAAEKARADDAAHAVKVERAQTGVSNNVATKVDASLADVRDRRDRLRAEANAHSSGGRVSPVSGISSSPGNAPCPAIDLDILAAAEENSVKLIAWQKWYAGVAGIER